MMVNPKANHSQALFGMLVHEKAASLGAGEASEEKVQINGGKLEFK